MSKTTRERTPGARETPPTHDGHLVSVIVPVFNGAQHLGACLDSIRNQTYPVLEIVVVDDGSTDATPEILELVARDDERISVIRQENQGVSRARNEGLRASTGNFLTFVDADDVLHPDLIARQLKVAVEHGADMVVGGLLQFREDEPCFANKLAGNVELISGREAARRTLYGQGIRGTAVSKLYHQSLKPHLDFPLDVHYAEDLSFSFHAAANASLVARTNDLGYGYRIHTASTMHASFTPSRATSLQVLEEMLERTKNDLSLHRAVRTRTFMESVHILNVPGIGAPAWTAERERCLNLLRQHRGAVHCNRSAPRATRTLAAVSCLGLRPLQAWARLRGKMSSLWRQVRGAS